MRSHSPSFKSGLFYLMKYLFQLLAVAFLLVTLPATAHAATPTVEIFDEGNLLSPSDESTLRQESEELDLPPEVSRILYFTYEHNHKDVSTDALEYLRDNARGLLNTDGRSLREGTLLIGVGLDPMSSTARCSNDVCEAISIEEPGRLNGILDQMEAPVRGGNYTVGLLLAAKAAGDPSIYRKSTTRLPGWSIFIAMSVLAVAMLVASFLYSRRVTARRLLKQLDFNRSALPAATKFIIEGDKIVAGLNTPLINEAFKAQWEQIKTDYRQVKPNIVALDSMDPSASTSLLFQHSGSITQGYRQLHRLSTAKAQLDDLQRMAKGEKLTRSTELGWLKADMQRASAVAESGDLPATSAISALLERIEILEKDLSRADFSAQFARLLADYRPIIGALPERLYAHGELNHQRAVPPQLGEQDWHPGMGTHYMPYNYAEFWVSNNAISANLPPAYRF